MNSRRVIAGIAALGTLFMAFVAAKPEPATAAAGGATGWIFGGQYGVMAGDPGLLPAGTGLRMYYSCYAVDLGGSDICVATSTDGLQWTMPTIDGNTATLGRVLFATRKGWDGAHETPYALTVGSETWLYVVAYADAKTGFFANPSYLVRARATDGLHFTLDATPVLSPTPGGLDDHGITSPTVLRDASGWTLVYTGWCLAPARCPRAAAGRYTSLLGATSTDGLHWTRIATPLIADAALPAWASGGIAETHVFQTGTNRWALLFTALGGTGPKSIGLATATTPLGPWTLRPTPLLAGSAIAAWADKGPVAPHGMVVNGHLRMWYAGEDSHGPAYRVGYAEFAWPVP
jgi:hypothetical protein